MRRRELLSTVGVAVGTALAGCVGSGPDTGTGDDSDGDSGGSEDTSTPATPSMTGQRLTELDECPENGSASVAWGETDVTVTGCLTGRNGCSVPVLGSAEYDAAADELAVTVTTEEDDAGGACTQALTDLGYEATMTFENGLPDRVVVTHETMGETTTAADASR
ncbi:hypothetical protein [Salinirubrum litoreum]|uniref:Uncharacterized protein n=1 Tax=Salinirubrum litoreum TaxID=1126234 RepID=A0ABD5REQ6_9EURY|nr:hypothetical protein [Salinirubrum litoreum]